MNSENKTLADVQPGGRVRLGDHDEKPPQELPDLIVTRGDGIPLPDQAAGIEEFKRRCLRRIEAEYPHLSAKPSPGGQAQLDVDDLAQAIRKVDGRHLLGAGALAEAILSELPHLAARQPVGGPVEVLSCRVGNDTSTIDKAFPAGTKLYFVPAQAVDLGKLQRFDVFADEGPGLGGMSVDYEESAIGTWVRFDDVKDLIDGKAVGNK